MAAIIGVGVVVGEEVTMAGASTGRQERANTRRLAIDPSVYGTTTTLLFFTTLTDADAAHVCSERWRERTRPTRPVRRARGPRSAVPPSAVARKTARSMRWTWTRWG